MIDSTMKHQYDDKQSTNDEDEIETDSHETTTDTNNDNDHLLKICQLIKHY